MIIERPHEIDMLRGTKKWTLVYGRRKTGKTFLVKSYVDYDEYFFVRRDRSIISGTGKIVSYETFIEILGRELHNGKTVVVDEFHRLGDEFLDHLHYTEKKGRLILVSSTLFLSKKLFSSHSPLLGLFAEVKVGLISLEDCIRALKRADLGKKELLEIATLLKEPIAIEYFDAKERPRKMFARILMGSIKTIPALVGEIFLEEERVVSAIYEGILRAIADGKTISSEISSDLFSKKLIKKDDPSVIQQYLSNLMEFGMIKRIRVFGKDRFVYKHSSPLARLFYYVDEKYNVSEREPTEMELERIIDEIMPKIMEDSIREFLAQQAGLEEAIVEAKDYDVDACLLKFKRPKTVAEIKWKKAIGKEDLSKAERSMEKTAAEEKLLFVPDKRSVRYPTALKVVDVSDFS